MEECDFKVEDEIVIEDIDLKKFSVEREDDNYSFKWVEDEDIDFKYLVVE